MKRFSKILNREISDDEIFEIKNYKITIKYTDLIPGDTIVEHTINFKFKFDFSDLDAVGKVIFMEEIENSHWNTKPKGIMSKNQYFFQTIKSDILTEL